MCADDYPLLKGVDTEGAEQLFSVAKRWQQVLSNAHPVHEELLLLLFARDHNRRHSCYHANEKHRGVQEGTYSRPAGRGSSARDELGPTSPGVDAECAPDQARPPKRQKSIRTGCVDSEQPRQEATVGNALGSAGPDLREQLAPEHPHRIAASSLRCTYVWANTRSKTVHYVVLKDSVSAGCGYYFGESVKPQAIETASVGGCFTCGSCFGWRAFIFTGHE